MSHDPLRLVAEILGEPAGEMSNPVNAGYLCPFIAGTCTKTAHHTADPLPVCSVFRRGQAQTSPSGAPICVCPNRFLEASILQDVIENCWVGDPPINPQIVPEVSMEKFGNVDFVVADVDASHGSIRDFVSVELQAVDITGSYLPAYEAITERRQLEDRPTYGFNWSNVRKRFVLQLITKGYYHHHWGTRIAAVIQSDLFDAMVSHAGIPEVSIDAANIVFLLYQYKDAGGRWAMVLDRVVPTMHSIVMQSILYETPPSRDAFESRVLDRLHAS